MSGTERETGYRLHYYMLIPMGLGFLWFYLLEKIALEPRYILYARLDDYIPFISIFIIPYVIWYFFVAAPSVLLLARSPRESARLSAFLASGLLISCAFYTFMPNGQLLRPDLEGVTGLFAGMVRALYRVDTPTNSAPSLHVILTAGAHTAILRHNRSGRRCRWVKAGSYVLSALIIVSTVLIKQHSVLDLIAGLAVSAVLYAVIYRGADIARLVTGRSG